MLLPGMPMRRAAIPLAAAVLLLAAGSLHPGLVRALLTSNGFLPHGVCFSWQPGLVWLHVVSDLLIALAYFSIPVALVVFARKRRDLPFHWIFLLFGLFIVSCGATHVLDVWTLWTPTYWLDGAVKALTALASVPTAIATVWLIPRALALPSTEDLRQANERLEREVAQRARVEAALREAQATLEERVAARTRELTEVNRALATANAEHERLAQELRRAEAISSVFIDQTPIGLALLDRDLRYVRVNAALARMNGFPAEAHLGKTVEEALPDIVPGAVVAQRRVVESGESVIGRDVHGATPASPGEQRHWAVSYYPVIVDAKTIGVGVLCEETTDKRRFEAERAAMLASEREARAAAEAASTAKDEFLAAVSHELRNPLQSILGWVQALEFGAPSPEFLTDVTRRIGASARLQARLIDDLLDASRIVSSNLVIERAPTDLRAVVSQAAEGMRALVEARGLVLATAIPPVPAMVDGDAHRLHQVVTNLLSNAAKFTEPGGRVALSLAADAGMYVIAVSDTGRGIAPDFLPHVFEPFRQERKAPGERGLGLGLAIVRQIVQLHGGSVAVSSGGPGRGATFVVRLPRTRETTGEIAAPQQPAMPRLDGMRILVVDDEDDPREAMATLLAGFGASVFPAASVDDALAIVQRSRCDLVLTDIAMPERDGFGLLAAIRRMNATAAMPVVALSAFAGEQATVRSLAAGFDAHLAKPVEARVLVETIARLAGQGASGAVRR